MGIERVVLVARWAHYTDGGYTGTDFSYIGLSPTDEKDMAVSRHAFVLGLDHTVRAYGEAGIRVTVLEQAPEQRMSPERAFARAYGVEGAAAVDRYLEELSASRDQHVELQSFANASFREHASRGELTFMETADLFCGRSRCPIGDASVSYYFDDDHLSIDGASRLEKRIQDMLHAGSTAQADILQDVGRRSDESVTHSASALHGSSASPRTWLRAPVGGGASSRVEAEQPWRVPDGGASVYHRRRTPFGARE